MKDVQTLIQQRDKLYTDQTNAIFERIVTSLDGIRDYLIHADPSYTPGTFSWEELSVFDELLVLNGIVRYDVGSQFILDGDTIEITEDNKEYFNRVLRIVVPLVVINQYNADATFNFFATLHAAAEEEQAIEEERAAIAMANKDQTILIEDKSLSDLEFDLDDLTEEQRKSFMIGNLGKVN